jgi:hypothetical protein
MAIGRTGEPVARQSVGDLAAAKARKPTPCRKTMRTLFALHIFPRKRMTSVRSLYKESPLNAGVSASVNLDVARVRLKCGAGASVPRGGRHGHDGASRELNLRAESNNPA